MLEAAWLESFKDEVDMASGPAESAAGPADMVGGTGWSGLRRPSSLANAPYGWSNTRAATTGRVERREGRSINKFVQECEALGRHAKLWCAASQPRREARAIPRAVWWLRDPHVLLHGRNQSSIGAKGSSGNSANGFNNSSLRETTGVGAESAQRMT